jgi:hypothetical protein
MIGRAKWLLGISIAVLTGGLMVSLADAQQPTPENPVQAATPTAIYAITTQDIPANGSTQPTAPQPTTASMPMGSGANGMEGTSGMGSMGTACPMMGQMGGGSPAGSGMPGTTMNGMSMAATGMSEMAASNALYDADGRFVFWNLNPWWVLGWVFLALVAIGILASAVFGGVTLIRRARRQPVETQNPS